MLTPVLERDCEDYVVSSKCPFVCAERVEQVFGKSPKKIQFQVNSDEGIMFRVPRNPWSDQFGDPEFEYELKHGTYIFSAALNWMSENGIQRGDWIRVQMVVIEE